MVSLRQEGKMAQNRGSKGVTVLLVFVAGLAGTACLLLLASRPFRCLLAQRTIDAGVALVMVLLFGLGAALITLLSRETRRMVVSLYAGVALALVGFVVAAWLSPSPAADQCVALAPAENAARPTRPVVSLPVATVAPLPAVAGLTSPTPIIFHSVLPTPPAGRESGAQCVPVAGGRAYVVKMGDTLVVLATRFRTTEESLIRANCLESPMLREGQILYVPDLSTGVACVPRSDWPRYLVGPGDTLFGIAGRAGAPVTELQRANCLGSTLVIAGTYLRVPRLPSPPTAPPRPTATITPDGTSTPKPN